MDNKKCYTFAGGPTQAPDFLKQALDHHLFSVGITHILFRAFTSEHKL